MTGSTGRGEDCPPPTGQASDGGPPAGPDDRSDADLLYAHVEGDSDAFATLFRRHRDRLWSVALRTLGDRDEAADALQDALLSAHRGAGRFRGDAAVTTWLHRIVVNACLDRIRRRQARPTVPLPDGHESQYGRLAAEPPAAAPDHDAVIDVRQALARLPVEQRAAIVLVDMQGYSVTEVASILGVAEGTVKSRCARGRARLAVLLGDQGLTHGTPSVERTDTWSTTRGNLAARGRVRSDATRAGRSRAQSDTTRATGGGRREEQ